MNAGAFGSETWNIVDQVEMINAQGQVTIRMKEQFKVAYRSVEGNSDEWFLAVVLSLKKGEAESVRQRSKPYWRKGH